MIKIRKILCPVDFFPGSDNAVSYAAGLAAAHGAKVHLLHVVSPVIPSAYADGINTVELTRSMEQASIRQMKKLVAKVRAEGITAEGEVVTGQVKEGIERSISDLKPDLIAMGTHNRSSIERWFMGSVTEWLIRHSPVPVLTVAPRARAIRRKTAKRAA
jgi:nucleotide-binding universal stress UspA family protein